LTALKFGIMAMQYQKSTDSIEYDKQLHASRLTLRNYTRLIQAWDISEVEAQLLLGISLQGLSLTEGSDNILLNEDQIEIASYLLALHSFVDRTFHSETRRVKRWLNTPLTEDSPTLGQTPLEYLLNSSSKLIAAQKIHQWMNLHL